jgi:hypothetical protein
MNEGKSMNQNVVYVKAATAGGILAAIFVVLTLLSMIPILGCVTGLINCLGMLVAPGLLAAYMVHNEIGRIDPPVGAISGAISGAIAITLPMIVSVIISSVFGMGSMMSQAGMEGMAAGAAGIGMMIVIAIVVDVVLIGINAGVGAIYGLVKNR